MLPLSEELKQAIRELHTWAHLHKTPNDTDLGVWRALETLSRVLKHLERQDQIEAEAKRKLIQKDIFIKKYLI